MRRRVSLLLPLLAGALMAVAALSGAPARAALLEGVLEPGDLIKGHAKAEADCENCHSHFNKQQQDELCVKCHDHDDIARDLADKKGYHGKMKREACKDCHADHKGRDARIVVLDEKKFDHDLTDFALKDKHREVKCEKCHVPALKKYRDAPQECYGCHKKDDKHKGALGEKCDDCHSAKSWKEKDVFFDHDKTKFKLKNAHADTAKVKCEDCHPNNHYKNTPVECNACHKKDDEKKGHRGRLGAKCENCHTDKEWKTVKFDHDRDTKYPLRGKHADSKKVKCQDCHTGNDIYHDKLSQACIACHQKDDKHKGVEGDKCEKCHNERDWKETKDFDHNKTKFPLKGKHGDPKVKCDDCHKTKVYTDTPMDCYSCHKKDDDEKGHRGRFGPKCESCHTEKDWKKENLKFDHDRDTKYPLRGKHKETKCQDCHTGLDVYNDKLRTACIACHQKDDKHKGVEGDNCDQCHYERDWKTTKDKFDHGLTRFPLLGKHADKKVKCEDCHKSKAYAEAPLDCWSCHEKDDKHKRRLGRRCEDCHNAVDWKRWDFDHDTRTHFKIDGAHKKLNCYDCHSKPTDDAKLPMSCVACHRIDDAHGGSFGPQCERCHVTKDWKTIKVGANRPGASARDSMPLAEAMPWVWTSDSTPPAEAMPWVWAGAR